MENQINCISCQLPVKEYKQNKQEREDLCENCFIADASEWQEYILTEDDYL